MVSGLYIFDYCILIMFKVKDRTKQSIGILNNVNIINDITYKRLLENCFAVLIGESEIHATSSLINSKPDVLKEVYAALLTISAEFVRHNQDKGDVIQYLVKDCSLNNARADIYGNAYSLNKQSIEISLINIGSHPPHITDVNWKIDYIIKSSNLDEFGGPLFRISLSTEVYDLENLCKKIEYINLTCNSHEMQELLYKLKDAVKHCERLVSER